MPNTHEKITDEHLTIFIDIIEQLKIEYKEDKKKLMT